MNKTTICTDDEFLEVDLDDIGELESAMIFKAQNIKAKADPQLFMVIAFYLRNFWNRCAKLNEQADKYRWHDLRKNPDDLPNARHRDCIPVLIMRKGWHRPDYCEYGFVEGYGYYFIAIPQDEVIAWKEIEPFEEVEE